MRLAEWYSQVVTALLMEVLAVTVFFSLLLALLATLAFAWDHRNRRGDGYDREALRPLDEDGPATPRA
jgi:cbb3-type cytochrome oxidase maturation protein